jgi:hypothetical protein
MGQNIINSFTTVCNFIRPYDQLTGSGREGCFAHRGGKRLTPVI